MRICHLRIEILKLHEMGHPDGATRRHTLRQSHQRHPDGTGSVNLTGSQGFGDPSRGRENSLPAALCHLLPLAQQVNKIGKARLGVVLPCLFEEMSECQLST